MRTCAYQWNEGGLYFKGPDLCSNRNVSSRHCIKAQGYTCDRFIIQTSILESRWYKQ